jgi:hypothetical protein
MKSTDAFPGNFLKSSDLKDKQQIVTISHLEIEAVGQDKREKPVLHFEDGVKPMVVNKTNFETIEEVLGDSDNWSGHKLKLFCVRTTFGSKKVDGLRVEVVAPKPAPKDEMNDEVTV